MTETSLHGFNVAILATDGFEQSELLDPREALEQAGADTEVVSLKEGNIRGWHKKNWGEEVVVDDNLITSRKPDDIPAFNRELINTFGRFHRRRDDARRQAVPMDLRDR